MASLRPQRRRLAGYPGGRGPPRRLRGWLVVPTLPRVLLLILVKKWNIEIYVPDFFSRKSEHESLQKRVVLVTELTPARCRCFHATQTGAPTACEDLRGRCGVSGPKKISSTFVAVSRRHVLQFGRDRSKTNYKDNELSVHDLGPKCKSA